jgi:hypothetical protein
MLKPLLRVIPNLSGNVKLTCTLSDFNKINDDYIECHIRGARLLPLSSELSEKVCEVNLLNSTYEFDIKKFYAYYSNYFYDSIYDWQKDDYTKLDKRFVAKDRDIDFEYGVKRVSYQKNGTQFAFFAPIWIESKEDIPDSFKINIRLDSNSYDYEKTLEIIIKDYDITYNKNYFWPYINKYAKQLSTDVVYCNPLTNQAVYYGIDLVRGGFSKIVDSLVGSNYCLQSTINKFDQNICEGFRRNKLCIKQVMPLSFYFDITDILTEFELDHCKYAKLSISGQYYKNGKKVSFYDFSTNYNYFTQSNWLCKDDNVFEFLKLDRNVMDVDFPSLKESKFIKYKNDNTLTHNINRWKLKYSNDENPYITNLSSAFSSLQNHSFKYREYPGILKQINAFCDKDNNLVLPLKNNLTSNKTIYSKDTRLVDRYKNMMQDNVSNWFVPITTTEWFEQQNINTVSSLYDKSDWYKLLTSEDKQQIQNYINVKKTSEIAYLNQSVFENINYVENEEDLENADIYVKCSLDDIMDYEYGITEENSTYSLYTKKTIFDVPDYWSNVIDNKVYSNGVLYNLSYIWRQKPNTPKFDKFGVFVVPTMNSIKSEDLKKIKSAKWTLLTGKENIDVPNAFFATDLRELISTDNTTASSLYDNEMGYGKKLQEVSHDKLFFLNDSNKEDGSFIDLIGLGYDIYEINKYYKIEEIQKKYPSIYESIMAKKAKYVIDSYELLPIYRLKQILSGNTLWIENFKSGKTKWLYEQLYFNTRYNLNKSKYDKRTFSKAIKNSSDYMLEFAFLLKKQFISASDFRIFSNDESNLTKYAFCPICVDSNEVFAENVFTKYDDMSYVYGDTIPQDKFEKDIDMMYVDPYNLSRALQSDISGLLENPLYSRTMYARFLNNMHLKVFLSELYADENGNKNPSNRLSNIYVKRRVLFNDYENKKFELRDNYIPLSEIYRFDYPREYRRNKYNYISEGQVHNEICSRVNQDFYFDKENNCWRFSDQFADTHDVHEILRCNSDDPELNTYWFELVFKKNFIKVDEQIWTKININNKDTYKDLYVYRISREDDLPKLIDYICSNEYENLNDEKYVSTSWMLQPLFDTVFLQEMEVSMLYSEYNQSKISESSVIGTDKKYYRYDVDNIMFMYDISTFNHKYTPILDSNGNVLYSYSYINNLISQNSDDEDSMSYKFAHKEEPFFDTNGNAIFNYLPTYRMVDKAYSQIMLGHGTEPVLQYYSALTYNYIDSEEYNSESFFSQYNYDKLFSNGNSSLDNLHIEYDGEPEYDENTNTWKVSYKYTQDQVFTYRDIRLRYLNNIINYNDLGLYDEFGISTYNISYSYVTTYSYIVPTVERRQYNGLPVSYTVTKYEKRTGYTYCTGYSTYAMIFIDLELNNTNSSFNLIDLQNNDKKYFTYINKRHIDSKAFNMADEFKYLVPFIKDDMFKTMKSTNYVIEPKRISFNAYYMPNPLISKKNNVYAYDILINHKPYGAVMLERYFDAITPYIPETSDYKSTYMLKYKDIDSSISVKDQNNEASIYSDYMNINVNKPIRLYSSKNEYEEYSQAERKHFNNNKMVNLEHDFDIFIGNDLIYEQVLENEENIAVLEKFSKYIRQYGEFNDDEVLFLYNKYDVKFDSYCVGIDYRKVNKVYSLTLKFMLK